MTRNKALIFLILTAILWSTGGLFIKLVNLNPIAIAGIRSGIAALLMFLYIRRPIKLREINRYKWFGAISYALLVLLFVSANKLTTSANAILLQYTAPVWVVFFSWLFLKEKIRRSDIVSISVVLLGMSLFFLGDLSGGHLLGNIIALVSGIFMAAAILFIKHESANHPIEITLLGNLLTFILAIPFYFSQSITPTDLSGLLFLGVFQLGLSYILYTAAISHVSSLEAILIPILEPLLNPVWVLLFTGEIPGIPALIGGVIVIATLITRDLHQRSKDLTFS